LKITEVAHVDVLILTRNELGYFLLLFSQTHQRPVRKTLIPLTLSEGFTGAAKTLS
jgi:hypothetical protein